jgi:hypothetical protein
MHAPALRRAVLVVGLAIALALGGPRRTSDGSSARRDPDRLRRPSRRSRP